METLETKFIDNNKFDIELKLVAFFEQGFTLFSDKWGLDQDGLIKGEGNNWNCNWYKIGQLNKGNDVTVYRAQKEFDRDCEAFDVGLMTTVSKNGIELINDHVIGADYSFEDKHTTLELFNDLIENYLNIDDYIKQAEETLKELIK